MAWPFNFYSPTLGYWISDIHPVGYGGSDAITREGVPEGEILGSSFVCEGGPFEPDVTRYNPDAAVGPFSIDLETFEAGLEFTEPVYYTIHHFAFTTYDLGQSGCDPPVTVGSPGAWSWTMDGNEMPLVTAVPDGDFYTPTDVPMPVIDPPTPPSLEGDAYTGFDGGLTLFKRPVELGPPPFVPDPADPMVDCLFTPAEIGVVAWSYDGWAVGEVDMGNDMGDVNYRLVAWRFLEIPPPVEGSILLGDPLGGVVRLRRVLGQQGVGISPE